MLDFLLNFGLGCCGFIFYSLWNSRKYFSNEEEGWIFSKFLAENYQRWIFNAMILLVICIIVVVDPTIFEEIKNLTGLELSNQTPGGFFTLGLLMIPLTKTTRVSA